MAAVRPGRRSGRRSAPAARRRRPAPRVGAAPARGGTSASGGGGDRLAVGAEEDHMATLEGAAVVGHRAGDRPGARAAAKGSEGGRERRDRPASPGFAGEETHTEPAFLEENQTGARRKASAGR